MKLLALLAASALFAQDPYKVAGDHYKLEFENALVRVSRVTYTGPTTTAEHEHPPIPTLYVYLTDGAPIKFIHKPPSFTVQRKPVVAGQMRFNRNAHTETHETEYLGNEAAEYLRVEFKTKSNREGVRDAFFKPDSEFPWEDEQIRISKSATKSLLPGVLIDMAKKQFRFVEANAAPPAAEKPLFVEIK